MLSQRAALLFAIACTVQAKRQKRESEREIHTRTLRKARGLKSGSFDSNFE